MLEGKVLAQANEAFRQATGQMRSPVSMIGQDIRIGRKKAGEMFAKFREFHENLADIVPMPIKQYWFDIESKVPKGKKTVVTLSKRSTLWYMAVEDDGSNTPNYGLFTPSYLRYDLHADNFTIQGRPSPFCFAVDHIQFRFREGGMRLDYQSDDFLNVIAYSLAISRAVSKVHFSQPDAQPVPVVLPHANGLFMGYAESVADSHYDIHIWHNTRGKRSPQSRRISGYNDSWSPTCRIVLKTFVSQDKLSRSQEKLRTNLLETITAQEHRIGMNAIVDTFQSAGKMKIDYEAVAAIDRKVKAIVDSDEWKREMRIGQKHLPDARAALRDRLRRRDDEGQKGNQPG